MPLDVRRTVEADRDLFSIWSFVAVDNRRAADVLINQLTEIFRRLSEVPEMGRARPELGDGLRSFPHGRYLVVYQPRERTLMIVRVLSSYRDLSGQTFPTR